MEQPVATPEVVVDASVWVSVLVADDEHHTASVAWLARQIEAEVFLVGPTLLLVEVAAAIARRTGDQVLAAAALAQLGLFPLLRLHSVDEDLAAAAAALAGTLRLRGADAVYGALARHLDVPLVTWDNEQIARAGAVRPIAAKPVGGA